MALPTREELECLRRIEGGGSCSDSLTARLGSMGLIAQDPPVIMPLLPQGLRRRSFSLTPKGREVLRKTDRD